MRNQAVRSKKRQAENAFFLKIYNTNPHWKGPAQLFQQRIRCTRLRGYRKTIYLKQRDVIVVALT